MPALSLVERTDIILLYGKYESLALVQRVFEQKYRKKPPRRETIAALFKKFKTSGSVLDAKRTGKLSICV